MGTYDHVALANEIEATYRPPFHAGMATSEMLAILNRDVDLIRARDNLAGQLLTPEQFRQDKQHEMDRAYVEMLLADRGLILVDADNVHWTVQEKG